MESKKADLGSEIVWSLEENWDGTMSVILMALSVALSRRATMPGEADFLAVKFASDLRRGVRRETLSADRDAARKGAH